MPQDIGTDPVFLPQKKKQRPLPFRIPVEVDQIGVTFLHKQLFWGRSTVLQFASSTSTLNVRETRYSGRRFDSS